MLVVTLDMWKFRVRVMAQAHRADIVLFGLSLKALKRVY